MSHNNSSTGSPLRDDNTCENKKFDNYLQNAATRAAAWMLLGGAAATGVPPGIPGFRENPATSSAYWRM